MPSPLECEVRLFQDSLRIAYRRWLPDAADDVPAGAPPRRMLCVHGWLDNCGSFDNLARLLAGRGGWEVVCVDSPGCGLSQHLPNYATYGDYDEVGFVREMLRVLRWDDAAAPAVLAGHSRGGGVVATFAAAFPELVRAAVVFDNAQLAPHGGLSARRKANAADALRLGHEDYAQRRTRRPKSFATAEEAVVHCEKGFWHKLRTSAENITLRHLEEKPGGRLAWTPHVTLYGGAKKMYPTSRVQDEFAAGIVVPLMLIRDQKAWTGGWDTNKGEATARAKIVPQLAQGAIDHGGPKYHHHIHSDFPETCYGMMTEFLDTPHTRFVPVSSKL